MNRIITGLLATLIVTGCTEEAVQAQQVIQPTKAESIGQPGKKVIITAATQTFALLPTAAGVILKSDPFIEVKLDQFTLRAHEDYKFPIKVLRYNIGLASWQSDGKWNIVRRSESVEVNEVMTPGQTKSIQNFYALIPIDGMKDSLSQYWLTISVETEINGKKGYIYANSPGGLF
jgi:hypothetical protein